MFKYLSAFVISLAILLSVGVCAVPTIDDVENTEGNTEFSIEEQPLKKTSPSESDMLTGTGVEADPYLVTSAADLAYIAERTNAGDDDYSSAFYRQTADIVLPDSFVPIGTKNDPFTGVYDGAHHLIMLTDCTVTTDYDLLGLFGYARCAYFQNTDLHIEVEITYTGESNAHIAALCGYYITSAPAGGTFAISNCSVSGRLQTHTKKTTSHVGGLIGEIEAKNGTLSISDCSSELTISSESSKSTYVGGIVAKAHTEGTGKLTLERLFAKSQIRASCSVTAYAGGIAGYYFQDDDGSWSAWYSAASLAGASYVCNLRDCVSAAALTVENARVTHIGYLCALTNADFKAENCYYTANNETASCGSKPYNGTELVPDTLYTTAFLSDTLHLSLDDDWHLDGETLHVLHPCLNTSLDGQTLNVRVNDCEKAKLVVSFFDGDGRIVSTKLSDTEAFKEKNVPFSCPASSFVRVFLLREQSLSPQIENTTVYLQK